VTCATAVAHSLNQRLRPRERSKYSWITKKRRTRGLSHVTQSNMADDTMLVRVVDEMMNVIDFVEIGGYWWVLV